MTRQRKKRSRAQDSGALIIGVVIEEGTLLITIRKKGKDIFWKGRIDDNLAFMASKRTKNSKMKIIQSKTIAKRRRSAATHKLLRIRNPSHLKRNTDFICCEHSNDVIFKGQGFLYCILLSRLTC